MTQTTFHAFLLDLLRQAQMDQNAFFQQLPAADLTMIGTPERWEAKDHVAHMTFWRRQLVLRLQASLDGGPQPEKRNFEEVNPVIFEEQRYRPWPTILAESDQVYAELVGLVPALSEEDLTVPGRFEWLDEDQPLYLAFMGNCYEHTQIHLAQYLLERGEPERALETYERWSNRVIEAEVVPEMLKGYMLYNLACFYATHERVEQAKPVLQRAFGLFPATRGYAVTDPDLEGLGPFAIE